MLPRSCAEGRCARLRRLAPSSAAGLELTLTSDLRIEAAPIEDVAELEALYRRHLGLRAGLQAQAAA